MHKLKDIMSTDLVYVTPSDNAYQVASLMKENNIGMIPVVEDGLLKGIITDRDLVIRGIAEKKPNSSTVEEMMSDRLVYGDPDMTVNEATQIMANAQIRRLPVIDNYKLVGIVSLGDLAVSHIYKNEVAYALSEISENSDSHTSSDILN